MTDTQPPVPRANFIMFIKGLGLLGGPQSGWLALMCVAIAASAIITLGFGHVLKTLVDHGFVAENTAQLNQSLTLLLVMVGALAVASFARLSLAGYLSERLVADLRVKTFGHLLRLDPAFFDTQNSHEMASRIASDTALVQGVIATSLPLVLRNILMVTGGLGMLIATSPRLTLLVIIVLPLVAIPVIVIGRIVRSNARKAQDEAGNLGGLMGETLSGIQTVQSFGVEGVIENRFALAAQSTLRAAMRQTMSRSGMVSSIILILFSSLCVVLWYGAHDVIDGTMSAGDLTSFVFYAGIVASAFGVLGDMGAALFRAAAALDRINAVLSVQPTITAQDSAFEPHILGSIAYKNTGFTYGGKNVVNDLSLDIPAGTTAAIVGASGEGKTTLFKLLMRLYDVTSGSITIDGHDIRSINLATLRHAIAYVPQDAQLFSGTLRDNIAIGCPGCVDLAVEDAARSAFAHDFIKDLPNGYDTLIGERGMKLSGGQRQRIALARALLKDAPILLLDEATASLDTENEQSIQGALRGQHGKRTLVIIAHRLSTVMEADLIFVLQGGRVVEAGTHTDLIAKGGLYARMVDAQFLSDENKARRLHPDIPTGIIH